MCRRGQGHHSLYVSTQMLVYEQSSSYIRTGTQLSIAEGADLVTLKPNTISAKTYTR